MSETFKPAALLAFMGDRRKRDLAKIVEAAHAGVDATARAWGLVEVEVVAGEEPGEGVEFRVVPVDDWTAANCWECGGNKV